MNEIEKTTLDKENAKQLDPFRQRALDILRGKEESPNETISFLVGRTEATKATLQKLTGQIEQVEIQLARLRAQAIELRGAMMAYADDITILLQREESHTKIVTPPQKTIIKAR